MTTKLSLFFLFFILLQVKLVLAGAITVVDVDNEKKGVKSEVYRLEENFKDGRIKKEGFSIGETNEDGYLDISQYHMNGKKIKVRPIDENYAIPKEINCPAVNNYIVKVTKIKALESLKVYANLMEKNGEYSKAALLYNEIYARAPEYLPKAEEKVYVLSGKYLNNKKPVKYDMKQGKEVISVGFVKDIKKFQKANGIRETGILDYKTLRKVSGTDIGNYLGEGRDIKCETPALK